MQFIALRDFYRPPDLKDLVLDSKAPHENHIHKGATFEIGTGKTLKDLTKPDQVLVATLALAKCVGDATDPKVVQAVKDEVALDKRRAENHRKLDEQAQLSHLSARLSDLLAKAAAAK